MRMHVIRRHPFDLVIAGAILLVLTCPARPSAGFWVSQPPEETSGDCGDCHNCASPSSGERCLRTCTRRIEQAIAKEFASKTGPDVVILSELADLYLPVPFDHKGHGQMASMTGGCAVCHHYTPENVQHPACKTCHSVGSGGDIRMPGLKGAYHRQCISCHREWSGETGCNACHTPRAGLDAFTAAALPTPDDLVGRMHPPIPEPESELYHTVREGFTSTQVLFRHKGHIHNYDLRCSDCHREDNCSRCHAANGPHVQHVRTLEEHHKPCLDCHAIDRCESCHFEEGESPPAPFDHAATGWELSSYHQQAGCRACHTSPPYKPLDPSCNKCHANWSTDTFDHTVTGQALDELHAGIDCEVCHADRNFAAPPSCTDCHDANEGFVFPAKRPGPLMKRQ